MYSHRTWMIGLLVIVLWGCATTEMGRGRRLLKRGQYEEAVAVLEQVVKDQPQNPGAWTELGVAYYRSDKLDQAEQALKRAQALDAENGRAIFFLGMTYEKRKRLDQAIAEYRKYTRFGRLSVFRYQIEARLKALVRQQIAVEVAQAIRDEAQLDVATIPDSAVAVLYFRNVGSRRDLDPLQKGLTDMLITDLSKVSALEVVERVKLQKLLEEMGLGMTGLVDEATAPRMGKLLGAARVVKGAFSDLSEDQFRIDAAIAEVKTQEMVHPEAALGTLEEVFGLEKQVVFSVVEDMGIALTKGERDAVQEVPTESLMAFLAYCRGLDYEDRGMVEEAKEAYEEAVRLDPGFDQAKVELETVSVVREGTADLGEFERVVDMVTEAAADRRTGLGPVSSLVSDRVKETSEKADRGFVPQRESRTPGGALGERTPVYEPPKVESDRVKVEVEGRLP